MNSIKCEEEDFKIYSKLTVTDTDERNLFPWF